MISNYKIFALIFIPAALAMIFGLALIHDKNTELSAAQFEQQLKNQWRLVSIIHSVSNDHQDKEGSPDNAQALTSSAENEAFKEVGQRLGLRVTLINHDGAVIFDSGLEDDIKEDHSQREEIRNAFLGVPSMSTRRSATTGLYTIYYAERLNQDLVLRVAYPADYYEQMSGALISQTFSGLLALVVGVGIFAFIISKNTGWALKELSRAVTEAKNGSQNLPTFNNESLDSVLYSLSSVTRELKEFGQKNEALNDRLKYILDNIQEGVILIQEDTIIYSNEKTETILGYKLPSHISEINNIEVL
ncbi:MAG: PAS domain-containing protein, partial [Deltaproteobacteria bacterium]|nr:PAS domain-containing protein [Deltaproteobacteria bacterium]